ncbi:MAG: branched-chain amino acid ABC transporter permease, partial [Ardenticatenia bacterium]|nr:branched-chain amino acid ABC transporter permease [Ardenticatenia bacterium]
HILMVGTFTAWWLLTQAALPTWAGVGLALVVVMALGFVVERVALRPLVGRPLLSIILMTLALSQVMQGGAILLFTAQQRRFPQLFPLEPYRLPEFTVAGTTVRVILKQNLVWSFVIAMVAVVLFALFFQYTRMGLAMRATAEDHQLARSLGLQVNRIFGLAWAISGVVATVGGVLLASLSGLGLELSVIVLKAFPAVLLGGLESIPGAIIGGLAIGVIEALVQGLPKDATIRSMWPIAPYIMLIIALIVRPEGLFGLKRIERI